MSKLKDMALGIVTPIGGFVDAGQLVMTAQAGALYQRGLPWVLPLAFVIATLYCEMAARTAMSTRRALFDAVRERLGFRVALAPLLGVLAVNMLTLVVEVAGMAFAIEM